MTPPQMFPVYPSKTGRQAASLPRRPDPLGVFLTAFNTALLAWLLLAAAPGVSLPPALSLAVDNIAQLVGVWTATAWVCVRLRLRSEGSLRRRLPALCLALGAFLFGVGDAVGAFYEDILHRSPPHPSWGDVAFLAAYPFLFGGVLLFPLRPASRTRRVRIVADGMTTMTACVTLGWYFLIGPSLLGGTGPLWVRVFGASYLFSDLILLFCVLALTMRGGGGRPAALLTAGLCAVIIADIAFAIETLQNTYRTGWPLDAFWPLGYMLMAYAGLRGAEGHASAPPVLMESEEEPRLSAFWHTLLPYAMIPVMLAVTLYTRARGTGGPLEAGVYLGCAVLLCLILARQALALREKHDLNLSLARNVARLEELRNEDSLTGLLNHRAFQQRLAAADAGQNEATCAVVLLDITDFRLFNDVYGHAAGDSVLVQVARVLQDSQESGEVTARHGGDEFAVLVVESGEDTSADIARRLQARLAGLCVRPPGADAPIPVSFVLGVAVLPKDAGSAQEALSIADERLRRAKSGEDGEAAAATERFARTKQGFALLNAYVTALDAKDRYTRRHSEDVMVYSLEIARALGLGEEVRAAVELAALLHDVGKIGVPDRILRKPGRLTDEEFEAIQQHPTMGAIMVGAVPGFEPILDAVRHHHERWDGKGYPDGLRGEETPLIARLMAVADSYSAMTTDRPYRKGMDPGRALAILESGAETQWDPACVRAFLAVRAGHAVAAPTPPVTLPLAA